METNKGIIDKKTDRIVKAAASEFNIIPEITKKVVFAQASDNTYLIQSVVSAINEIKITYSDFINTLPNEVVEVTGCVDCFFRREGTINDYCTHPSYPNNRPYIEVNLCPLLTKSITIKLKQNDTARN
jgi:hypothetical protein